MSNLIKELKDLGYGDADIIYAQQRNNYYSEDYEGKEPIPYKDLGIEVVEISDYTPEIREMVEDSYVTLPIHVVILYKNEYFRSDADYGSYIDSWTPWRQVDPRSKTITVYE